jgi:hypothetical protein
LTCQISCLAFRAVSELHSNLLSSSDFADASAITVDFLKPNIPIETMADGCLALNRLRRGDCVNNGDKAFGVHAFALHRALIAVPSHMGSGEFMQGIALAAIAGIFSLVGCTTHLPEPNATINVEAITFAILTELYCATSDLKGPDKNPYFGSDDNWVVAIDMFLSAQIEASANPAVSLLGPYNLARAVPFGGTVGSFTSVFSGSFDETATNLREYKIFINLKYLLYGNPLPKTSTPPPSKTSTPPQPKTSTPAQPKWETYAEQQLHWPVRCDNPNAGGTYLQGRLGLEDWLAPAVSTQVATIGFAPLSAPASPPTPLPPTISDIFPSRGPTVGNYPVQITGTNFPTPPDPTQVVVVFGGKTVPIANMTATTITVLAPGASLDKTGSVVGGPVVDVVVNMKAGTATSKFTYDDLHPLLRDKNNQDLKADDLARMLAAGAPGSSSGASQSPTVSGTFTFVIKSTGTIGPSFTLSRVSGGSNNLFTMVRTDNNYVNIALTPATYCPLSLSTPAGSCPVPGTKNPAPPSGDAMESAFERIDSALLNLNLSHIQQP